MKRLLLAGAMAFLAGGAAVGQSAAGTPAVDSFYASLLRDGELLAEQGKSAAAAKSLRTACFGMLDQPLLLARCLVRLGLAQAATGDGGGFRETFSRLLDLESRAPSYSAAELAPPVRAAFEQQVAQRIPSATLAASPTFQKLGGTNSEAKESKRGRKAAAPPADKAPTPAPPPAAADPVTPPAASAPPESAPGAPADPRAAKAAPPAPAPAASAGGLNADERSALATARARMQEAKVAADLLAAGEMARKVADAHPSSIEANALAGEIFYRGSRWQAAAVYLTRSGPPASQPVLGFYLAVAQFESGDRAAAATTLRPLLGKLQHTAYVQGYVQKILPP